MSGITIGDNPILGIIILAIFDIIAFKIAFKTSNTSAEHWASRTFILVLLSAMFIAIVNLIKWVMIYWLQLLIVVSIVFVIVSASLYLIKTNKIDKTE